ncbi:ORF6N domain-containing protein [Seonamhaeicola sp.]|uniref:ORF6N domain-containing protein n=1 Tax=Seonamhaeicola sp. TaxID=1912245 RepID=UPI002602F2EF|nr:ORF6N domain-containing protein [Seonamhaeicola sp.]
MKLTKGDKDIAKNIIPLRNDRIILDIHLAQMYEVETRALKQQVRRNLDRFPEDFMFELNASEIDLMVSQNVIPNKGVLGGAKPMAFTEQGVAMLSSVLRSKKAVEVNIAIMRTFVHVRRILEDNQELAKQVKQLEKKYDEQFQIVFNAIKKLIEKKNPPRNPIGYKAKEKK